MQPEVAPWLLPRLFISALTRNWSSQSFTDENLLNSPSPSDDRRQICGYRGGMGPCSTNEAAAQEISPHFSSRPTPVWASISQVSSLWAADLLGRALLSQLWLSLVLPFPPSGRIRPRALPGIDFQGSSWLAVVRVDKLFASPAGCISTAVPVWLSAKLFFVIPSDGNGLETFWLNGWGDSLMN